MRRKASSFIILALAMLLMSLDSFSAMDLQFYPNELRQVEPLELVQLKIQRQVEHGTILPLKDLLEMEQGLTLSGAEIKEILIKGSSMSHFPSGIDLLLNQKAASPREFLTPTTEAQPIIVHTNELVDDSLDLKIKGEAYIEEVHIQVGKVSSLSL